MLVALAQVPTVVSRVSTCRHCQMSPVVYNFPSWEPLDYDRFKEHNFPALWCVLQKKCAHIGCILDLFCLWFHLQSLLIYFCKEVLSSVRKEYIFEERMDQNSQWLGFPYSHFSYSTWNLPESPGSWKFSCNTKMTWLLLFLSCSFYWNNFQSTFNRNAVHKTTAVCGGSCQ
jgi:hypothetical protein